MLLHLPPCLIDAPPQTLCHRQQVHGEQEGKTLTCRRRRYMLCVMYGTLYCRCCRCRWRCRCGCCLPFAFDDGGGGDGKDAAQGNLLLGGEVSSFILVLTGMYVVGWLRKDEAGAAVMQADTIARSIWFACSAPYMYQRHKKCSGNCVTPATNHKELPDKNVCRGVDFFDYLHMY